MEIPFRPLHPVDGYLPIEDHGLIGNFPQAFTHVGVISSGVNVAPEIKRAREGA